MTSFRPSNLLIKATLVLVALLSSMLSISNAQASERSTQAWQALAQGATLIDVRTIQEFEQEHLSGALHIPLSDISTMANSLDPSATVVVYCRSGNRASHAKQTLHDMGFKQVINGGGLEEMKASKP
ncbi:Thiosulfate sulfurtransferase PspE precursor [Marinomonas aquimarina]|uniref:Thiosulfate sulfurtransferase PspE n=1 Tax=Marinomonas aquimarina TaxID=295068 RepID=A0A1A8T991_9GAMM|nr:rhodanese-like domain-containing protein [Marinomonas aquimarina]SBS28157.1 Thiosulfate sulfurtransferase PspE precursor [Marinomonas aquimarina]